MDSDKVALLMRNRPLRRQIDSRLANNSLLFCLLNSLLFLICIAVSDLLDRFPILVLAGGGALAILLLCCLYLASRFSDAYGAGPARWRKAFFAVQVTQAFVVSSIIAFIVLSGVAINGSVVICTLVAGLYLVAASVFPNLQWAPYVRLSRYRIVVTLLPTVVTGLLVGDALGACLALGLAAVGYLGWHQAGVMYHHFWSHRDALEALHAQAHDLTRTVQETSNDRRFHTEFFADLVHQIRSPLNDVMGVLDLLQQDSLAPQQARLLAVGQESGRNLVELLADLSEYSRSTTNTIGSNGGGGEQAFSLAGCIGKALQGFSGHLNTYRSELNSVLDASLPIRVIGDPARVSHLLQQTLLLAADGQAGMDLLLRAGAGPGKAGRMRIQLEILARPLDTVEIAVERAAVSEVRLLLCRGLAHSFHGDCSFDASPAGLTVHLAIELPLSTQQVERKRQQPVGERWLIADYGTRLLAALSEAPELQGVKLEDCDLRDVLARIQCQSQRYERVVINLPPTHEIDEMLFEGLELLLAKSGLQCVVLATAQQQAALAANRIYARGALVLSKPFSPEKLLELVDNLEAGAAGSRLEEATLVERSGGGGHILLVEDNRVNQMVTRRMLEALNYTVDVAMSGEQALELLSETRFDLVLMDCLLPGMDGYETTKRIREQALLPNLPVIALTASGIEDEEQRCLAAGMDDFLTKPVSQSDLDARIRRWLNSTGTERAVAM